LADGAEGAHAELRQALGPPGLNAEVLQAGRDLLGVLGHASRRELVRRFVGEIARPVDPRSDRRLHASRLGDRLGADEDESLDGGPTVTARLPAPGVVAAEHDAVDDRSRLLLRGQRL
jgi:hypothetical protein